MIRTSPRLMTAGCLALYLFMYAPLLVLMVYSFTPAEYSLKFEGVTLKWYQAVFRNDNILAALKVSLMVAIPTVLISTAIGTITAFTLYRSKFVGRALYQGILYIPLIMPDLVIGISLLLFYSFVKLELGILSILLAHVSFSIPLTTLVIIARMQRIDRSLEDAAMDLGADEWTTMWKVTLPLLKPGIVAAALLTFPWSFNDFVITFFVSGVGSSTLPLRVYSMIRLGVSPMINALGTLIVLVPLILVIIGTRLARRSVS
ncbi:MAG: ABC transporter permease [Planctomycetes bacterium]|nr:ABC transporter permease [Planctomycetota bacterium]